MNRLWSERLFRRADQNEVKNGDLVFKKHYGYVGKMAGPYRVLQRDDTHITVSIVGIEQAGSFVTCGNVYIPHYRK